MHYDIVLQYALFWRYYTITALERDQYEVLWSSCVVNVLLHTALFHSNFEILWKLKFLKLFEFFWNVMKFLKVLKFYENFEFLKKKFRNCWNFTD